MTYGRYLRELAEMYGTTYDRVYGPLILTEEPRLTNYKGKAVYEAEAVLDHSSAIDEEGYTPRFACIWYLDPDDDPEDLDWSETDAIMEGVLQWDGSDLS